MYQVFKNNGQELSATLWRFIRMDPGRVNSNNNDMCRSCIKLMVWGTL